jgi:hypothetical protein
LTTIIVAFVVLLAIGPLTIGAVRFARRHRRVAFAATSLLLLFGVNFKIDPPPPPRIEAVIREDEEAKDDEPK